MCSILVKDELVFCNSKNMLLFSQALLRMDEKYSYKDRMRRVEEVIVEVSIGVTHILFSQLMEI